MNSDASYEKKSKAAGKSADGNVKSKATPSGAFGSTSRGGIQSIERAIAILESVANRPDGISLTEISSQISLHNSTVFHLIKTLANLGIVDQISETKRYRIGSRLFRLAAGAMDESAMLAQASPILERVSRETGETAHLAVRSREEVVIIAQTAATGMFQLSGRTGATRPPHATAIGKVLFSEVPAENLDVLLNGIDFQRFTDNTITDKAALIRELALVRKHGCAFDNCELDDDLKCVAMPVRDFADRCVGAIGFSGPVWRMGEEQAKEKTAILRNAAEDLSQALGFREK